GRHRQAPRRDRRHPRGECRGVREELRAAGRRVGGADVRVPLQGLSERLREVRRRRDRRGRLSDVPESGRHAQAVGLRPEDRAGRLLLGYAQRMLALSREARQALDQFQGRMSGELVVGGSTIPGEYVLPALIGRFKAKYPEISVSLLIGASRQVTEWAEEGRVEVAMVGAPPAPRSLAARELMADELVVVVPADHPWVGRKTVALADL